MMLRAEGTANGGKEFTCNSGFHDIPESSGRKAPTHKIGIAVNAQENNARCTAQLLQTVHSLDSIENGHGYISDDDIRLQADGFFDQRLAVADLADNVKLWLQETCFHLRKAWMIVRQ